MTTLAEVGRMRLVSQRLVPAHGTAAEVVRWMTCTQAQDFPAARIAVALRTGTRSVGEVTAALDAGEIVRSWPMRGTLHLVAAEDLGWMLDLTLDRQTRQARARHVELGITAEVYDAAEQVTRDLLGRGPALRADLMAAWQAAGVATHDQRGPHLIGMLAQRQVICLGPMIERSQAFVLSEQWITTPRRLERGEAIVEWAQRYFRSHGPAPLKDFLWWTKLLVSEVRPLLDDIREPLGSLMIAGVEYFHDPLLPDLYAEHRRATARPLLLPSFDEILLGYGDRSPALDDGDIDHVVPGKNGFFHPTVMHRGRIVATWRRPAVPGDAVTATPFTSLPSAVERALPRLSARLPHDRSI
ncbi:winged helix DNA-binding domain-containing protein [Luteipulveratus halotolerans]|uniref:Winged helix DNA-binding domain-containing protein n=1 Tax=Luteipulveratus halotolerans TaxID=1631356 RepID=A0A0L6CIX7_9MICO|nr:winged helix DNA-binding domain-containing protein [Luteipulveratus halotolerans]KNX37560.1 hypothetical protein VV01_11015 [Luteipulveratus halotolerans]